MQEEGRGGEEAWLPSTKDEKMPWNFRSVHKKVPNDIFWHFIAFVLINKF